MKPVIRLGVMFLGVLMLAACGSDVSPPPRTSKDTNSEPEKPITNRVDVPAAVRRNLGVTFAKVTSRHIERTRRVPGRFELRPEARRAYHTRLAGHIDLHVKQYQSVKAGDVLFVVRSPTWREVQRSLSDTVQRIRTDAVKLRALDIRAHAVEEHGTRLLEEEKVWKDRLKQLKSLSTAGGGVSTARTEARAQLAAVLTAMAKVHEERAEVSTERLALQAELEGYRSTTPLLYADGIALAKAISIKSHDGHTHENVTLPAPKQGAPDLALQRAASLLGVDVATLQARTQDGQRTWRMITDAEVRATRSGVIESLGATDGAWVDVGDIVIETVNRTKLRFRGSSLQADLADISDGLAARVLPPGGNAIAPKASLKGTITISLDADPHTRKIDLLLVPTGDLPTWARPGVSTEMELVLGGTSSESLAIPTACVIRDGLERIFFRRDPKDKDKVIRVVADLGQSDGKWVTVESGVMEGDDIVHHGVYELMLASGSAKQTGGHFHADGTWHADDHE